MRIVDHFIQELDEEADATRRVLERVPGDKLDWRPHPKSMTLGQLALHVADTPGNVADLCCADEVGMPEFGNRPQPESKAEILQTLDQGLAHAKEVVGGFDDARAMQPFRIVEQGKELMALPKAGLMRGIMLNHWYHHRGQLTVYLRLLDVPVPAVYGASADENPMRAMLERMMAEA